MACHQPDSVSQTSSNLSVDECLLELTRNVRESSIVGREVSPADSPLVRRAAMSLLLGVPSSNVSLNESVASWSMDEPTTDDSSRESPRRNGGGVSPEPTTGHGRRTVKQYKNELWAAIRPDFMYLMDEEIIDACKSTESEFSSDDMSAETKVSYNEFLQQYKELTDWLGYLQVAVSRQTASRSESYLNQMYHEEMLKQSPRQQLLKDYAKELLRRYPQLKQEISLRLTHVNELWYEVMDKLVLPSGGGQLDLAVIIKDVEEDVTSLRIWVNTAEKMMSSLCLLSEWSVRDIQDQLVEHQAVQKDIESRSRVMSAVMKLCDWMNKVRDIESSSLINQCRQLHQDAAKLEERWHSVWIQSVEWQVRLEDALCGKNVRKTLSDEDSQNFCMLVDQRSRSGVAQKKLYYKQALNDSASELTDGGDNSDVIPFDESEYEEIVESDPGNVDDEQDLEIELRRNDRDTEKEKLMLDEWMETELCGELKFDVSYHNISIECDDSKSASESAPVKTTGSVCSSGRENFDVGYSSESHSYDEREVSRGSGGGAVNRVKEVDRETADVVPFVGRQSTTSAYNSASDLSDNHRSSAVNDLQHRNYYCTAGTIDVTDSAADHQLVPRVCVNGTANDGCCTDDDFSKLKELSFDDIPMMFMRDDSHADNMESVYAPRRQGRSLDSLLPSDSEKLFKFEKRVSSVEVIIDSLSGSVENHANVCGEILLNNSSFAKADMDIEALSSCDASSEGTLSESECSESAVSDGDASPRKYKLAKRTRRDKAKHEMVCKWSSSSPIKSPIKRRGESLTDVSEIGELDHCLRCSSDGAITDLVAIGHCTVKRSRICRTQSDMFHEKTPKPANSLDEKGSHVQLPSEQNYDAVVPDVALDLVLHSSDDSKNYQDMSMYCDDINNKRWETDDDSLSFTDYDGALDMSKAADKNGRLKCGRSSVIVSNRSGSWQDSDSDTEDFLNIVTESRKAYTFTESTLQKFLRDHIDGVIRDPVEFMAPLATCQTNINCLLELVDALHSGTKIRDADSKIQQINNIVIRWQQLENQTVTQQQQCRLLHILYTERIRCEKQLSSMLQEISIDKFDDLEGIEAACRTVQAIRCELQTKVNHQLKLLDNKVVQFQNAHQDVEMKRFTAAVEKLQSTADTLTDLCSRKESHLKKLLMAWYQLTELQCHLEYVLAHEEHQIDCLDIAADIVHLSEADFHDTVSDLQLMRESWLVHNDKLQLMESLRRELADVCTEDGQFALKSSVNVFAERLQSLRFKCDQMIERMTNSSMIVTDTEVDDLLVHEPVIETLELDSWNAEKAAASVDCNGALNSEDTTTERECAEDQAEVLPLTTSELSPFSDVHQTEQQEVTMKTTPQLTSSSSMLRRLLRYALPLPLILMFIFGGLYLLYDDWFDRLDRFGLCIYPQLHHVRGAPPV